VWVLALVYLAGWCTCSGNRVTGEQIVPGDRSVGFELLKRLSLASARGVFVNEHLLCNPRKFVVMLGLRLQGLVVSRGSSGVAIT
jgi:hypothetical protein